MYSSPDCGTPKVYIQLLLSRVSTPTAQIDPRFFLRMHCTEVGWVLPLFVVNVIFEFVNWHSSTTGTVSFSFYSRRRVPTCTLYIVDGIGSINMPQTV